MKLFYVIRKCNDETNSEFKTLLRSKSSEETVSFCNQIKQEHKDWDLFVKIISITVTNNLSIVNDIR